MYVGFKYIVKAVVTSLRNSENVMLTVCPYVRSVTSLDYF